ncbi:Hypothetical protein A7982_06705 [Minicystis rosea]|nr:Hypothetical protein A7982_06705 [Minicystis rosea]
MKSFGLSLARLLVILAALAAPAEAHGGYQVVWDDFRSGFTANTSDARWFNFSMGPFVADDGLVSTSSYGLSVVASGRNPITHLPAFVKTMGQDTGALSAFDHVKWLVIMNHTSSKGLVGFDAKPGEELACEARISGQIYGTWGHPFGNAVFDPDADPRLGAVATSAFDPETFMIFNFLVTNKLIYAFYEHPPFVRDLYGDYAAFSYAVPVATRWPYQQHDLKIAYDKAGGKVRWLIDGNEVFRVDTIGARIDRRYMLLDRGGDDMIFSPDQLDCGMGTFTFLDGYGPTGRGLVQIEPDEDTYFNPRWGEPFGVSFLDEESAVGNRLFGEGAAMQVRRYVVSSRPLFNQCH